MKLIRSFLTLLLLTVTLTAFADEPQVVVVNGKKCYVHTIGEGDTLYSLAQRYDVSLKQIEALNPTIEAESLSLGAHIYIPYKEKTKSTKKPKSVEAKFHKVEHGDTVYSLARRYKTTEQNILTLNGFESADQLLAGMTIKVRDVEMVAEQPADEQTDKGKNKHKAEDKKEPKSEGDLEKGDDTEEPTVEIVVEESAQTTEQADTIMGIATDSLSAFFTEHRMEDVLEAKRQREIDSIEEAQKIRIPVFKRFQRGETLNVVLMLPMHRDGRAMPAYVDFYRGVLLGLEDLRRDGYSINVHVFDTERTLEILNKIVTTEQFLAADLIIGPVYREELQVVVPLAEERNIPVVTPLSDINPADVTSPVLFQMQADRKYKYKKYAHIFDGSYTINLIYAGTNDLTYANDILRDIGDLPINRYVASITGSGASFNVYNEDGSRGAAVAVSTLTTAPGRKANIIVADRDYQVAKILSTLGERVKKMSPNSSNDCFVIGNREWDEFEIADRTGYFTSGLSMIAPYNSKRRDNDAIKVFEARFLRSYGILPTAFACRGYDAMVLFCTKMFTGLDKYIMLESLTPLATTYKFMFEDGMFINTEWVNIQFNRDFTVTYK